MSTKASNLVFVLCIILEGCCVIAQITSRPLNAAGKVGDQIIFNCTSSSGNVPGWKFSQNGVNFQIIGAIASCSPAPNITQFRFEKFGIDTCNVIVDSVTTKEAGAYKCIDSLTFEWNAQLTVIESVTVSVTPSIPKISINDTLRMTCTVTFVTASSPPFPMFPSIMWTNTIDNTNITGLVTEQSSSTIASYISVIAIPPVVPPYSCVAYFRQFPVNGSWASNIPTNNVSRNTPQILPSTPFICCRDSPVPTPKPLRFVGLCTSLNPIAMIVFIIRYACCKNFRQRMNHRFPELKRMLPCLNEEGWKCSVWIFLFIVVSVFAGIIYFPTIVIMAYCCKGKHSCKENRTDPKEGNGKGRGKVQTTPQTDSQPPKSLKRDPHQDTTNQDHSPYLKPNRRQEQKPSSTISPDGIVYQDIQQSVGKVIPVQRIDDEQGSHYRALEKS